MRQQGNYWNRNWNRRRFLQTGATAGVGAAAFAVVGCGGDDDDDAEEPSGGGNGDASATSTTESGGGSGGGGGEGQPKSGGRLRETNTEPDQYDPHRDAGYPGLVVMSAVYNALLRTRVDIGEDFVIESDLAEAWEQPDDTTYVFNIHPNAKWQNVDPTNGRDVTADDIRQNFERMVTDQPDFVLKDMFSMIDSIEAVDDKTVQVKLARPYGQFIVNNADVWAKIIPPEMYEGDQAKIRPVGSGPFIFTDAQQGVGQTLDKNPDFFREGKPYVDGIDFVIVTDAATRAAGFQAGELDTLRDLPTPIAEDMKGSYSDARYETRYAVMNPFMINNSAEPFTDPRIRQAMYHAIDPELITQLQYQGLATPGQPLPVWLSRYQLAPEDLPAYDPAEAKALLEAAGMPDGFSFTNKTFTGATAAFGTLQAQQSLADVGIEMTNEELEWANWRSNVYGIKGDFQVTIGGEFDYLSPDRQLFNAFHSTGSANNRKVNDPELDRMLEEAQAVLDEEEAATKYKEIAKYLVDNAISVWLPQGQSYVMTQNWVKGWFWQWSAGGLFERNYMDDVWLDR